MNAVDERPALTVREDTALRLICRQMEGRGYPPTMREIADRVGLVAPSAALYLVKRLAAKGYVKQVGPPGSRRIVLVDPREEDAQAMLGDALRLILRATEALDGDGTADDRLERVRAILTGAAS